MKNIYKEIDSLYKLPVPLNVRNITTDGTTINADKDKKDKNELWLKKVKEDIFIDESVKVLNRMITQNNVAKSN